MSACQFALGASGDHQRGYPEVHGQSYLRGQRCPIGTRRGVLAVAFGRDDAYLVTEFRRLLGYGMNMELRRLWLAGQLAELCAQKLLLFDIQALVAEEDNSALGD